MDSDDPKLIPESLFVGLYELIDDTDCISILGGLFDNCFPKWLEKYNSDIDNCKK